MSTLSNFFHSSRLRRRWRRQVPEDKTLPQFSHQHRFSFPPRQFPRHFFRLHTFLVWLDFPCRSCALFGFTRFPTTLAFTSLQASIPLPARWLCKLWQVSFQHFCTHLISKSIWWQVVWENEENIYIGFYLSMAIKSILPHLHPSFSRL